MMTKFKTALAGAAAVGLILAGAANAEPIRANATFPSAAPVKKIKLVRTAAPAAREARAVGATGVVLGVLAVGAAGLGIAEGTKSSDSNGG